MASLFYNFLLETKSVKFGIMFTDVAIWKAYDEEGRLFPGNKLGTWRSCCLPLTPFELVTHGYVPSSYYGAQFGAWFLLKASSQERVQRESPDLTALTPRLRSISEFHKECHSAVLGLQRSL